MSSNDWQESLDNYSLVTLDQLADIKSLLNALLDLQTELAFRSGLELEYVERLIAEKRRIYYKQYTAEITETLAERKKSLETDGRD